MAKSTIMDMTERAREIFRIIVENYLDSGSPMGSRTISRVSALGLSSASIRNVMQDLEESGLLISPHSSAGRLPTEKGLRLFVDGMMQVAEPTAQERAAIEKRLQKSGPVEEALAATTRALSGLSSCASMVMVPKREAILRECKFVAMDGRRILVILVAEDGTVENRIIESDEAVNIAALEQAGNFISHHLSGHNLQEAKAVLDKAIVKEQAELNSKVTQLVEKGLALWSQDESNKPVLIVRGAAHLIDEKSEADMERVRILLEELEEMRDIATLLSDAEQAQSAKIFIGSENKLFSLTGSSVIAAPCRDKNGRVMGVVGVIGPTRLNYARIVPMVDFTAHSLSKYLE